MRRAVRLHEVNDVGPHNLDSLAFKDMDELVEFPLGMANHPIWVAKTAGQPKDLGGKWRQIGYDADVT